MMMKAAREKNAQGNAALQLRTGLFCNLSISASTAASSGLVSGGIGRLATLVCSAAISPGLTSSYKPRPT
jgi:hypothetical protein